MGAHLERRHRRLGPVVGNVLDDGKARTAVGAVDERVTIATVAGIEKLAQAIIADGDIWRDGLKLAGAALRVTDDELGIGDWVSCSAGADGLGIGNVSNSDLFDTG